MEIHRQINVATRITFPIVDADGDTVTAAAALDSESTTWADGTNPGAFADLTNEATEIGTTGVYFLILTAAEMNFDYIYVRIQTSTVGAKTQHILINTRFAPLVNASGRVDVAAVAGTAQTAGDIIARLGTPAGASVSADIAAIEGQTDDIGVAGAGLTAVPWNAAWDVEVQSEVADALDVAIPGVPTADSINQRVRSMDLLTEAAGAGDLAAILVDTGTTLDGKLPTVLVGGRMDSSVGAMAAAVITAAAFAAGAIDNAAFNVTETLTANPAAGGIVAASFGAGAIDNAAFNVTETLTANPAAGGIVAGSFGAGAIDAAAIATGAIDADALAADAVDEIWDELMVEQAQGIPGATPAFRTILAYLYMAFRNAITVTSTNKTFSNDAGTVITRKPLSDDGTTYTEAEAVSGP